MDLSLVVPCYNEQDNVRLFAQEAQAELADYQYEIIFINDGSHDHTLAELKKLYAERKNNLTILDFSRNFGKEAAIYAGLQKANGRYIAFVDADLQQPLSVVREMLAFLEDNSEYDAVAAYQEERMEDAKMSWVKSCFYKVINCLSDIQFKENASDFRVIRASVGKAILTLPEYERFSKGIFSWVGFNTFYRPYQVRERHAGTSSWSTAQLVRYAINGILSFSTKPLKISLSLGILASVLAVLYSICVIIEKLFIGIAAPGYATQVILILLMGGIQLIVLGIQGEYLARIHIEVKRRPLYLAKSCFSCVIEKSESESETKISRQKEHTDHS